MSAPSTRIISTRRMSVSALHQTSWAPLPMTQPHCAQNRPHERTKRFKSHGYLGKQHNLLCQAVFLANVGSLSGHVRRPSDVHRASVGRPTDARQASVGRPLDVRHTSFLGWLCLASAPQDEGKRYPEYWNHSDEPADSTFVLPFQR